ncbi:hypothetical protein D9M71_459900 [compost metagenome]
MQIVDKPEQVIFIAGFRAKVLQRQACLGQAVGDGTLDPGQGYRVVALSHICSRCHAHVRTLNVVGSVAG